MTPAGTAFLRCEVDCGEKAGELVLSVVMAGDRVRSLPEMTAGRQIRAIGVMRALRGKLPGRGVQQGIEIVAEEIALDAEGQNRL